MFRRCCRTLKHWHLAPSCLFATLFLIASGVAACAQTARGPFDVSRLHQPSTLDATWLVNPGDDPAFARADFDDSHWTPFKATDNLSDLYGKQQPEVVWYRLHLKTDSTQKDLGLSEDDISRAFEIYANGTRILSCGSVRPYRPYTSSAHIVGVIPDADVATGSVVLAMRVHIAVSEWTAQDPGYYVSNLTIGDAQTLIHENWLVTIGQNVMNWIDKLFQIGLGIVALVLLASQRRQITYLWIAAAGLLALIELPEPLVAEFRNIPLPWQVLTELPRLVSPYVWASLYFSFVQQRIGWRWRAFLIVAGIANFLSSLQFLVLAWPAWFGFYGNLPYIVLLSVIVPVVLIIHWRRGNREAGILLIPVVLFSLYIYALMTLNGLFDFTPWRALAQSGLNFIDHFPAGPFELSLNEISSILCTLALAVIMLQRSTAMSRRQALLESELEAAQQVQQMLVPEHTAAIPGFQVESVYLPAQQVGGDFFQVLPVSDGMLVVVGDVAGKGLPAAMLVSALVGALRATVEFTQDPAELLAHLNERLVGRAGGGFATALAAHISASGRVSIANAGHLPPYLDGRELDLPGALPLGVAAGVTYEVTDLQIGAGSRLTFCSDGVIEAQNASGELFGFERSREISTRTATQIAEAAMNFGQKDDITVVAIRRNDSAPVPTAAADSLRLHPDAT